MTSNESTLEKATMTFNNQMEPQTVIRSLNIFLFFAGIVYANSYIPSDNL